MRLNLFVVIALVVFIAAPAMSLPEYVHECNADTLQLSKPCTYPHYAGDFGSFCWTWRDPAYCPVGSSGPQDCVEEFGTRECTSGEAAATPGTGECQTFYQQCGDGGIVKCSHKRSSTGGNPGFATFAGVACYRDGGSTEIFLNCKNDN